MTPFNVLVLFRNLTSKDEDSRSNNNYLHYLPDIRQLICQDDADQINILIKVKAFNTFDEDIPIKENFPAS